MIETYALFAGLLSNTRVDRAPKLWLYDEAGARRIEVSLLEDGTPGLRLLDRNEQIRAAFGSWRKSRRSRSGIATAAIA